jgi:acyl-CoA dehydrogenase
MDFEFDQRTRELQLKLEDFMSARIYPAEATLASETQDGWNTPAIIDELKIEARKLGLWNLFLPDDVHGAGLTNLQYAPLAEITGRSPAIAPEAINCSAPDTGNMEVLAMFGDEAQKDRWLTPLLNGDIRSAFAMTERDVASSDATNIQTTIARDGDHYVINGMKVWSSGAMSTRCEIFIVMGKTNPDADRHHQQSMVLVPRNTSGVNILRGLTVFGYDGASHGGHGQIEFDNVRVPISNLIGKEGSGFAIAQARLGPGRIHHSMRLIGMAERALELMCKRAISRVAFGKSLAEQGVVREWIAESRVRIEATRLLVLKAAWLMDTVGNKGAHSEIQAIKVSAPAMATWVIDRAIQTHGGAGLSQDFPLASLWAAARSLQIADGPDEVHYASIAKGELKKYA